MKCLFHHHTSLHTFYASKPSADGALLQQEAGVVLDAPSCSGAAVLDAPSCWTPPPAGAPLSSHPHRRAQAHPKQLQGSSSLTPPQNMFFLLLFSHCNILVVQMNQMKLWKISVRLQIHRNGFGHMRVYCFSQIPHDCCGLPSTTCKQETESKDRCTASVTAAAFLLQGPTWLSAVTTMPW